MEPQETEVEQLLEPEQHSLKQYTILYEIKGAGSTQEETFTLADLPNGLDVVFKDKIKPTCKWCMVVVPGTKKLAGMCFSILLFCTPRHRLT